MFSPRLSTSLLKEVDKFSKVDTLITGMQIRDGTENWNFIKAAFKVKKIRCE